MHWRPLAKTSGALWLLFSIILATAARAEAVLISDTSLVSGTQSSVFSFQTSGPGTVSVQLTNLGWPQALSSLSFVATTANRVLASWSDPSSQSGPTSLTFQVSSPGSYFADVMATAGGPLDLGLYSLLVKFCPVASPVPLPPSGWLLLLGLLLLIRFFWRHRPAIVTLDSPAAL